MGVPDETEVFRLFGSLFLVRYNDLQLTLTHTPDGPAKDRDEARSKVVWDTIVLPSVAERRGRIVSA